MNVKEDSRVCFSFVEYADPESAARCVRYANGISNRFDGSPPSRPSALCEKVKCNLAQKPITTTISRDALFERINVRRHGKEVMTASGEPLTHVNVLRECLFGTDDDGFKLKHVITNEIPPPPSTCGYNRPRLQNSTPGTVVREEGVTDAKERTGGAVTVPSAVEKPAHIVERGSAHYSELASHQSEQSDHPVNPSILKRTVSMRDICIDSSLYHYRQYLDQFGTVLRIRLCVPEGLKRALWEEKNELMNVKEDSRVCFSFVEYADPESAARCVLATDGIFNRFDGSPPSQPSALCEKVKCNLAQKPITTTISRDALFERINVRRHGKEVMTDSGEPLTHVKVFRECLFGTDDDGFKLKHVITNEIPPLRSIRGHNRPRLQNSTPGSVVPEEDDTEETAGGTLTVPSADEKSAHTVERGSAHHSELASHQSELSDHPVEPSALKRTVFLRGICIDSSLYHFRQYLDQFGTVLRVRVHVPEGLEMALWEEKRDGLIKGKEDSRVCFSFVEYADPESAARCVLATDGIFNRFDGSPPSHPSALCEKVTCTFSKNPITNTTHRDALFGRINVSRRGEEVMTASGEPLTHVKVFRECRFGTVDHGFKLKHYITSEVAPPSTCGYNRPRLQNSTPGSVVREEDDTDETAGGTLTVPSAVGEPAHTVERGSAHHSELASHQSELSDHPVEPSALKRTVFLQGISLDSSLYHYRQYLDQFGKVLRVRVCVPEGLEMALWEEKRNGLMNVTEDSRVWFSFVEYADPESAARCVLATDGIFNRFDGSPPSHPSALCEKMICTFSKKPITTTSPRDALFERINVRRHGKEVMTDSGEPLTYVKVLRECLFGADDDGFNLKHFITNKMTPPPSTCGYNRPRLQNSTPGSVVPEEDDTEETAGGTLTVPLAVEEPAYTVERGSAHHSELASHQSELLDHPVESSALKRTVNMQGISLDSSQYHYRQYLDQFGTVLRVRVRVPEAWKSAM
ncbi:hypothetical protein AGDE_15751 [Angomonas deanei]|nr:hypothetical protein AGDE_15751 [Angomonas deanei]|eukprot:EPY18535.1 hypothetical protein AGDE_15751 [Angomonas deanei]